MHADGVGSIILQLSIVEGARWLPHCTAALFSKTLNAQFVSTRDDSCVVVVRDIKKRISEWVFRRCRGTLYGSWPKSCARNLKTGHEIGRERVFSSSVDDNESAGISSQGPRAVFVVSDSISGRNVKVDLATSV